MIEEKSKKLEKKMENKRSGEEEGGVGAWRWPLWSGRRRRAGDGGSRLGEEKREMRELESD